MKDESPIIVAIDTPDIDGASKLLEQVSPYIGAYKLGLEFFLAHGTGGVKRIQERFPDIRLFLDLKLHDIPNTVRGASLSIASLEPYFLTVHASGGSEMIQAAVEALPNTRITAVTILTSLDQNELKAMGLNEEISQTTVRMAARAIEAGARALVCSPHEAQEIRSLLGPSITIITPGVRPASAQGKDDQRRTLTPREAISQGADFLVIGRPIIASDNPGQAAQRILAEIAG